ncbi:MAG: penicillin-binding protein [Candidatus Omnitrophica bacterium CG_4_9_14_0_2_um_filter_42_8]|nr:MAG: penicillin-binding protein [Candidatus Omnitrophica bacterium CG22_combo_CG10-13_8_21_14_all_43_16]PJC47843.1 MAG: penicillin-binding protein [Candidatus Omnitrophica bacterium CG_4_9_14_0_2_um_filter_42_8]
MIIAFGLLCVRLVFVQMGAAKPLSDIASSQYRLSVSLLPKRGVIYDRNLKELAISINLSSIFAEPFKVKDKGPASEKLAGVLGISRDEIYKKLSQERGFVWLARKVSQDTARKVRSLDIKGIDFIKEPQRVYPNGVLASHILGFTDMDSNGIEGLELRFDKYLKGVVGYRYAIRDAKQREVPGYEYKEILPIDGDSMVLTIDSMIQSFAENELEDGFKKYHAKGACIIVMDPYTGDILALSNRPNFDPNNANSSIPDFRRNRAVCDFFEPGSSFKIVAASSLLEEKAVKPGDKFFCENGEYKWCGHTYHDHKPHGWLEFRDVIKFSSNIGTMKAAQRLGKDRLYKYIKKFGFGSKTGIDLPGEVNGIATHPSTWSKLSLCSISMGQEVTVTAIQLACAISALANGGNLVKPRIVERIQDRTGHAIQKFESKKPQRVISEETAKEMRDILRSVVDSGTAQLAEAKGYFPAGKTGTAQKVEPNGTYSHRKFTASFIGFVPYDDPKFVIVVIMDEPRPIYYGGVVCAPVFKKVATQLMSYSKILPKEAEKRSLSKR